MSTMLAVAVLLATTPCAGHDTDVPLRLSGWSDPDAAWLDTELSKWMHDRDRTLCTSAQGTDGLQVELTDTTATIRFEHRGAARLRTVARPVIVDELFRYEIAAATEELVRSTWEAPPPPTFRFSGRPELRILSAGALGFGASLGAAFFVHPTLALQLHAGAAVLTPMTLSSGGEASGRLYVGAFSVSWLPIRPGVFRAGPRASVEVGAVSLTASEPSSMSVSATAPWFAAGGGLTLGVELKRVAIELSGELHSAIAGATVLSEGVVVGTTRGLMGKVALEVSVAW